MNKKPLMKTIEEVALIVVAVIIVSIFFTIVETLLPVWGEIIVTILGCVLLLYGVYMINKKNYNK